MKIRGLNLNTLTLFALAAFTAVGCEVPPGGPGVTPPQAGGGGENSRICGKPFEKIVNLYAFKAAGTFIFQCLTCDFFAIRNTKSPKCFCK